MSTVLALIYWVAVAAVGFAAATASWFLGRSFNHRAVKENPVLLGAARAETVRDWLLMVGLGLNFTVGVLALATNGSSLGSASSQVKLLAIMGGATLVSAFAVFNLVMRAR